MNVSFKLYDDIQCTLLYEIAPQFFRNVPHFPLMSSHPVGENALKPDNIFSRTPFCVIYYLHSRRFQIVFHFSESVESVAKIQFFQRGEIVMRFRNSRSLSHHPLSMLLPESLARISIGLAYNR